MFSVSSLASLGTIAALGGPVGWITAAVGVGLLIVASLLSDSDLETYFKNFLLSDTKAFPKAAGTLPMDYIRKILDERKDLTDDDYRDTLMNPLDAQAKLFDYIVCKEITFTPIDPKTTSHISPSFGGGMPATSSTSTASKFNIRMVFSRFFNHPKQVEAYGYFYLEGVKNGGAIAMDIGVVNKIYDTENQEALDVNFSVPIKYRTSITTQSEAVFAIRLKVDESQNLYFPYPLAGNNDRYLGAKIKLKDFAAGFFISDLNQNKDVVITSLSQLKTNDPW